MRDARVLRDPDPAAALAWLEGGGACALLVTRAKGAGVRCAPTAEARALLEAACDRALAAGALRALAWQAEGDVAPGMPVAVVGATGERRADAQRAVDLLVAGLKGVATRTDL